MNVSTVTRWLPKYAGDQLASIFQDFSYFPAVFSVSIQCLCDNVVCGLTKITRYGYRKVSSRQQMIEFMK